MWWRLRKLLLWIVLVGLCAWGGALVTFMLQLTASPVLPDRRADAIVVFTGGSGRIDLGLKLLEEGRARELLISGLHPDTRPQDLFATYANPRFASDCCGDGHRISLGYDAQNTIGNAAETAAWLNRKGHRTVILVTAFYHLPRSIRLLRHEIPELALIPYPAYPEGMEGGAWWRDRLMWRKVALEYHKYLWSMIQTSAWRW
jgi:uncharacterized SAM-binding protein YcdF (DUF218 family)